MSRQSIAPTRSLTLTEELEKLEQSITLTLQEIDHNFSKAHRIVTTSILPVVEQYANHSDAVREGSKFWKQFFEASANVSLSSYEETAPTTGDEEESLQDTVTTEASTATDDIYATPSMREDEDDTITGAIDTSAKKKASSSASSFHDENDGEETDSSVLDSPSVAAAQSTPRAIRKTSRAGNKKPNIVRRPTSSPSKSPTRFAEYPSPYEVLKREMRNGDESGATVSNVRNFKDTPITPGRPPRGASASRQTHRLPDMSMTPDSSPFADIDVTSTTVAGTAGRQHVTGKAGMTAASVTSASKARSSRPQDADPLLHRMLDRAFRIQATPHKNGPQLATLNNSINTKGKSLNGFPDLATPATARRRGRQQNRRSPAFNDAAFLDSPDEDEPPRLRPELFSSPLKTTPGVSVYTTAAANIARGTGRGGNNTSTGQCTRSYDNNNKGSAAAAVAAAWQSDSDDEDVMAGISPPKTIQFSVPQSKLLQTPAREASRRIVQDLLLTAGADLTESITGDDDDNDEGVIRPNTGGAVDRRVEENFNSDSGSDSSADTGTDAGGIAIEGDVKKAKGREKGRGRGEGRNTNIDDSPSIVRKKAMSDDDEF